MDAPAAALNFEEKSLIRAEQHERRRGRNNSTSCRSPAREIDTKSIKNELKEKRQLEFLKRRSVSPEMCGSKSDQRQPKKRASPRVFTRSYTSETLKVKEVSPAANGRPVSSLDRSLSESPRSSKWTSLWSDPVLDNRSASETMDSNVLKDNRAVNVRTTKTIRQRLTQQSDVIQVKMLRDASVQTESGFVTVKETDLQKLADYLQEALWREEILKKKLASLQEINTNLMNSSDKVWTSRCSEDLLRNKVRALEEQLQLCLMKLPKDAVKKLLFQMERQKLVYEDKAVMALQKATHEKTEAVTKADALQGALNSALTESQRWQRLYEELRLSSEQLRLRQDQSKDQERQLQDQLQLSRVREEELRGELVSLLQHNQELQYNTRVLQEDNEVLRDKILQLRDGSGETEELLVQVLTSEETETCPKTKRSSEVEGQLQQTLEKLQLKEKQCEELQTELSLMEQECQSTQSRLSQCREQLRLTPRPRTTGGGCRWLSPCLSLLLLLSLAVAAGTLWTWYPPFREQLQDFYSDVHLRVEDYLVQMSSPRHSGCYRPV